MQSSAKSWEKVRLRIAIQSARPRFAGVRGGRPTRPERSVAVDKPKATDLRLRIALATAAEEQPRRRADASCEEEACTERTRSDDGQVRPQLRADVRRLAHAFAQRLRCACELLALELEIASDVVERAAVMHPCHRSSMHRRSASPLESPAAEPAASPSGCARSRARRAGQKRRTGCRP